MAYSSSTETDMTSLPVSIEAYATTRVAFWAPVYSLEGWRSGVSDTTCPLYRGRG